VFQCVVTLSDVLICSVSGASGASCSTYQLLWHTHQRKPKLHVPSPLGHGPRGLTPGLGSENLVLKDRRRSRKSRLATL
jgi:hypothetical protein